MKRPLLVVGASGLGRETREAVRAGDGWDLVGGADDDPTLWGTELDGLPVLGPPEVVLDHDDWSAVLCPGSGRARVRLADRLAAAGLSEDRYARVVHPTAVVPASCSLGAGCVVLAGTVLTTSVAVGRHVVLMPGVVLTHDDVLGDYATVCARVALAGGVEVRAGAYLGTGCTVRQDVTVGAWATVGMGAVVLQDVPSHEVWAGVPARPLRAATGERGNAAELPLQTSGGRGAAAEGDGT